MVSYFIQKDVGMYVPFSRTTIIDTRANCSHCQTTYSRDVICVNKNGMVAVIANVLRNIFSWPIL